MPVTLDKYTQTQHSFLVPLLSIHSHMYILLPWVQHSSVHFVSCLQLPSGIISTVHSPYSLSPPLDFLDAVGWLTHSSPHTLTLPPSYSLSLPHLSGFLHAFLCFFLLFPLYMQLTCSALSTRHQLHPAELQYWWGKHYWLSATNLLTKDRISELFLMSVIYYTLVVNPPQLTSYTWATGRLLGC